MGGGGETKKCSAVVKLQNYRLVCLEKKGEKKTSQRFRACSTADKRVASKNGGVISGSSECKDRGDSIRGCGRLGDGTRKQKKAEKGARSRFSLQPGNEGRLERGKTDISSIGDKGKIR